ncbi:hypothetical protein TNCV_894001 [Trichonephila clavipes]|nr:hypothetical protein TNCV_894001 [Trichonephila clavipes]
MREHARCGNVPGTTTERRARYLMHLHTLPGCQPFHSLYTISYTSGNGSQMKNSSRIGVHETFRSTPTTARLPEGIFKYIRNSMQQRFQSTSGRNFEHLLEYNRLIKYFLFFFSSLQHSSQLLYLRPCIPM